MTRIPMNQPVQWDVIFMGFWALHVERNQFVPDDYDLAARVGGLQFRLRYWTIQGACQTHAGGWIGR